MHILIRDIIQQIGYHVQILVVGCGEYVDEKYSESQNPFVRIIACNVTTMEMPC